MNIGDSVGSYRIVGTVGEGGMGSVFLAQHNLIGRYAAIKVLHSHLCEKEEQVNRFFNEARATSQISHPGILEVYDFGWHTDGSAYIVMEFLEGESLEDRIHRLGRISTEHALHITRQVAGALAAAHAQEIVHRDLKPENIHIVRDPEVAGGERIKILDFGIAKMLGDTSSTRAGALIGTPDYMAPEQCKGAKSVDQRVDFYSLGCILFRMVCGRPPFVGEGVGEVLAAHLHLDAPSPRAIEPTLDPLLDAFIVRLLAKSADDRPQSAVELIGELDSVWVGTFPGVMAVGTAVDMGRPLGKGARPTGGPSTLSSAAMEIPAGSSSGGGSLRLAAISMVAVLAAGGVGYAMFGVDRGGELAAAPKPSVNVVSGGRSEDATDESAPKAAVEQITVVLRSEPDNAEVFRVSDGLRVGTTPYQYTLDPVNGELVYLVKLEGYDSQTVIVPANASSEQMIELERTGGNRWPSVTRPQKTNFDPFQDVDLDNPIPTGKDLKGVLPPTDLIKPPEGPEKKPSTSARPKKVGKPKKPRKSTSSTSPKTQKNGGDKGKRKAPKDNTVFDPFAD